MKHHILSAVIGAVFLSGCASQSASENTAKIETNKGSNVPAWVLNPTSANGFAASNCVTASGNFSIDRNHAVSLARNTLAQNLDIKVSVLEKNYQKIDTTVDAQVAGTSFEQIAKQITNTSIQKSQVEQVSLVNVGGVDQVCALVVMPKIESEKMFNTAVTADANVDPSDKAALYKEFVSQKTTKELEEQAAAL
jgi:PBP1b-binding outer membrane lipoprotein LpoB